MKHKQKLAKNIKLLKYLNTLLVTEISKKQNACIVPVRPINKVTKCATILGSRQNVLPAVISIAAMP